MGKTSKIFAAFFLLALLAGGIVFWFWHQLDEPVVHTFSQGVIALSPGTTPDQAIKQLADCGVIKFPLPLRIYIKATGEGKLIKAGDYRFASPISAKEVLKQLESGGQSANKLTIVEGWNRWDIAAAMAAIASLKLSSTDEALALMKDKSLIKDLDPQATDLEGYLYPETYFVYLTSKPQDLIVEMVKQFRIIWQEKLANKAKLKRMSVHDVVTIASIIETEAKLKEERPIIASVVFNRLNKNMVLGMDSTIVYASKLAKKWHNDGKVYQSDIDRDSPYNTRKVQGLPPGPVSSPGLPSLQAAVTPAHTDYLYYVRNPARNDGAHNFYTNEVDFQRGVEALRNWERTQH